MYGVTNNFLTRNSRNATHYFLLDQPDFATNYAVNTQSKN